MRTRFDRTRYPHRALCLASTEADVQRAIVEYLHAVGAVVYQIDVGGKALRNGNATRRAAGTAGVVDLMGVTADRRIFFIEVKRPGLMDPRGKQLRPAGKPTDAQVEFLRTVASAGALACVAWRVEDVDEMLG